MERVILTITSDLFDDSPSQEASIRKNLSIRSLIAEVQREFNLPEGNYALRLHGGDKALDPDKTLEQLGVQTGAQLLFGRVRRSARRAATALGQTPTEISSGKRAYLRAEENGQIFDIEWQPAIIGRPDANNPASAAALAVDLGGFAEARTVSRQHARLTERGGIFFVESMSERNPVVLNDEPVYHGERRSLRSGDRLMVGKIALKFIIHGEPETVRQTQPGAEA